jgi:hypothetical protein
LGQVDRVFFEFCWQPGAGGDGLGSEGELGLNNSRCSPALALISGLMHGGTWFPQDPLRVGGEVRQLPGKQSGVVGGRFLAGKEEGWL